MRGQKSQGFFKPTLPYVDNELAQNPDDQLRKDLITLCGSKWSDGPVCCDAEQVDGLKSNLKRAEGIISSCPACKQNFFNLFCTFTCSPDQSQFINITQVTEKDGKTFVSELDNLWADAYQSTFFSSCKDVKIGATGNSVMTFFGNAKNATSFLKFLGDKRPLLGSPFQINFPPKPSDEDFPGLTPADDSPIPCNTTDPAYRCACVDCGGSCAELPEIQSASSCHVSSLPCLSFAVILIYSITLTLMVLTLAGHIGYIKHKQSKDDRLRLLQDAALSDDDDDDDEDEQWAYRAQTQHKPTLKPYAFNGWCDKVFTKLGRASARYPAITITSSFLIAGLFSLGWTAFSVETDPVRLWVAPDSAAAQEKFFFDRSFGPFFRAEQAFLVNATSPDGVVPSYDTLKWWFDVEGRVRRIKTAEHNVTLEDICYKPTGDACVIQSISGYFQDSGLDREWEERLDSCAAQPADCRPDFGLPLDKNLILGGDNEVPSKSRALVTTWVVRNAADGTELSTRAIEFEHALEELFMQVQDEAYDRGLRVSFNTEMSLEQELNKSSNTDAGIVVISYIIMFIYASLALGSTTITARALLRRPSIVLIQSKFSLGVVGILIVLLSVSASVGLFSALGIKVTLIIAEVIPFLVLAVGVDNIFLIVHEFERVNASYPHLPIEDRVGRAMGRIGPSILLSATMETVAFALGTFVGMPAVRNFAAYAAGAVVINALLQVTMFVSALALNQRRVEDGRADCVPCVRIKQPISLEDTPAQGPKDDDDGLQRFIRKVYAPALLGKKAKAGIIVVFLGLFAAGLALIPTVQLGLEQQIAIPSDSYLVNYFNDLYDYFNAGPPVYFVVRGANETQRAVQQELCGSFPTCNQYSLASILEGERKRSEESYIASSTASWIDDFFHWLDPSLESCCVEHGKPCFADRQPEWNRTLSGMPQGPEFIHYLDKWIKAPSDEECAIGGKAAYSDALIWDGKSSSVEASHFRTSHTPLQSQSDLIESYRQARRIAAEINEANPGLDVFPYSKHYIFFDQYMTIVPLTVGLLAGAIAACFVISSLLLGSVRTGLVVAVTVTMTVVDIGGALAIAGVSLNAVTLVNLVICVGIAVEFCAHIARAFQFPSMRFLDRNGGVSSSSFALNSHRQNGHAAIPRTLEGRDARAWAAMSQVGGSVFSGITITKLLGVCVLAFTRSKIFEIYYFRVWLALVILAATHALILLPVLLSLFGGLNGE